MEEERPSNAEDELVNYAPAMPKLSSVPSFLERFARKLFRRRGGIRPVVRENDDVVVDTSE